MGATAGRPALVEDGAEFDDDDAALLRAVARSGSVAKASANLGRSRARALNRIETLEGAFGSLVERRRGGSDGGGSHLTSNANQLLTRFDRLAAALETTASIPETVLSGTVTSIDGELATVETAIGTITGIHQGLEATQKVQARIGADAITLYTPEQELEPDSTSARNRRTGTVVAIDRGQTVFTTDIEVRETCFRVLVTEESENRLGLEVGTTVGITWKATATQLVRKTGGDA